MRKRNVIILGIVLTVAMGVTAYANTGGIPGGTTNSGQVTGNPARSNNNGYKYGTTGVGGNGVPGNGVPGNTSQLMNNNQYGTTAAEDNNDWGWVGLLGLVGLGGLFGRNREQSPQR